MQSFSADSLRLEQIRPEIMAMKKYFDKAKYFPKYLITQNKKAMQNAYVAVPMEVWSECIWNLQEALQASRENALFRRQIVVSHVTGMSSSVDDLLHQAFLEKYDELMNRVLYDFGDFFPYEFRRTNQRLFVLEKMNPQELIKYVLQRVK